MSSGPVGRVLRLKFLTFRQPQIQNIIKHMLQRNGINNNNNIFRVGGACIQVTKFLTFCLLQIRNTVVNTFKNSYNY